MHICGIQISATDEPICRVRVETANVEDKHMDTKGEKGDGWGGMNWDLGIDVYTLHTHTHTHTHTLIAD